MDPINPLPIDLLIHDEHLHGGQAWSGIIRRHATLRLTALGDGANVVLLAFAARQPQERANLPDTLKAQHVACLTAPRVLMNDMGRVLLSVTADTCGWHDCLTGFSDAAQVRARFGAATYQTHRNDRHRNARDNLLVELLKHGLGERDLTAGVNCFTKVAVAEDGTLAFVPGHARRGMHLDLRAEQEVLVVLTAVPHPLDPASTWAPVPVHLSLWRSPPPGPDDACRRYRPECERAFARTEVLHA